MTKRNLSHGGAALFIARIHYDFDSYLNGLRIFAAAMAPVVLSPCA
jgi:hypothetical protein